MTTGKEAFESACQIGVAKSYNYRQLSQVFFGIDQAIQEIEISGGGNIVASGLQPDGAEEGQIAFFQGTDGNYYEYIWVSGSWVNVKTQNEDVTVAGSAPFITISGTEIETQRDINHYLNDKIESLILDPSGDPIDLEPFATKAYVDAADGALEIKIEALETKVSGYEFGEFATIEYVNSGDTALELQIAEISGNVDDVEVAQSALSSELDGISAELSGIEVRVTSGETVQENLVPRVLAAETTQTELVSRVASGETAQQQIVGRLDLLETTRGADKIYQVHSVTTELAVRNGELVFNNADATLVSFISLAPFDSTGNPSPLVNVGDIIDVEVGGITNRYQVAQGTTDAQSILCIYLSGNSTFAVDQTVTIYIYPQNSSNLATTEYVDEQNAAQDARSIKLDIAENIATTAFRLKAPNGNTLISTATGNQLNIYNLADPSSDAHALNRGYADARYLRPTALDPYATEEYVDDAIAAIPDVDLSGVLPLTGGTLTGNLHLDTGSGFFSKEIIKSTRATGYAFQCRPNEGDTTLFLHTNGSFQLQGGTFGGDVTFDSNVSIDGNLSFTNGGIINVSSGGTVLSGRGSLDIKTAADYPVIISSGSSYKKVLAIYGYDNSQDDNRGEVAYINANGNAYFNDVFSNGEKLATETYVQGNGMRWQHATHEVAADLNPGEFFIASNGNIYLHPTSYDGVNLSVGSSATSVTDIKQLGSVHRANGESAYHITWTQITYNNGANKYVRISKNATHLGDSTTQGEIYRLNIPGFTL